VGPRKTRIKITKDIATSIVRAAEAEPLPSLDPPPKFEELWNAFYEMPNGGGPETATPEVVSPGPGHVLAVEVTTASGDTPRWTPYRGGPAIAATVEDIALQKWRSFSHLALDPSAADFEAQAWSALEDATKQQATPILFVDPRCLKIEQCRAALERLLQRNWNGGVIIPADGSDKETARLVQNSVATLAKYQIEGSRITIRESIGTIEEFGTAVKSIADDILATITEVGEVQQRPSQQADGPDSRPRITNVLTAAQGPDPASK
jgi:hypothetical protein